MVTKEIINSLEKLVSRPKDTHKGNYGYVLVLGGSPGLTGAVCLCAQASLKIGAGLVRVGVPKSLESIFEIKLTEVMSIGLQDKDGFLESKAFSQVEKLQDKIDVFIVGPGGSTNPSTRRLFQQIIRNIEKPLVVDADGINSLQKKEDILKGHKSRCLVLTPHLGEFSRVLGLPLEEIKARKKNLVKKFAYQYNLILILKGYRTLVSDGNTLYENMTGNPGMATAGSGDVLSGIIGGLIAQGLDGFIASKIGVYLHGLAGDLAVQDKTEMCLLAQDIIDYLPLAIKRTLQNVPR